MDLEIAAWVATVASVILVWTVGVCMALGLGGHGISRLRPPGNEKKANVDCKKNLHIF